MKAAEAASRITAHRREFGERFIRVFLLRSFYFLGRANGFLFRAHGGDTTRPVTWSTTAPELVSISRHIARATERILHDFLL